MKVDNELLDRYLDGDSTDSEQRLLAEWLTEDGNLDALAARAEMHTDLRRSLHRRNIQEEALASCEELSTATQVTTAKSPRRNYRFLATVALTAVALIWGAVLLFPGQHPESRAIAQLAYASHAQWSADMSPLTVGDGVGSGRLKLDSGIVRLDFANGAAVTLQGPAEFDILDANRTSLRSGILTAHIPESAIGFEVETPAVEVVDLGTSFGVSVAADGETDVCVFEGEVEVSLVGETVSNSTQRVREGTAVRTRPEQKTIESVAYKTNRYEESWPVTSGVLQATGLMRFVSPGPKFIPGHCEDNEHILVFPERSQVVLPEGVKVDVSEPGRYQRVPRREQVTLPAGPRVRSYLLQLNPIGEFARDGNAQQSRVIGQITFDRPILGLIARTSKLIATDSLLGHPRGDYSNTRRGIEPSRPEDEPDSGRDIVTLSQDRRTLSLDLSAGSAVDQIRVIVNETTAQ